MQRIGYIVLFLCLGIAAAWADDKPKPGLQIEDNTFFDPSRKDTPQEQYQFGVEYRIEAGFTQHWQRAHGISYPDMYLNGVRVGATLTFKLPLHFGIQTGLLYTLVYGKNEQHWRSIDAPSVQTEYISHRVLEHDFTVPVRMYYTIPLWTATAYRARGERLPADASESGKQDMDGWSRYSDRAV